MAHHRITPGSLTEMKPTFLHPASQRLLGKFAKPIAQEVLGESFVSYFLKTRAIPPGTGPAMHFNMRKAMTLAGVKTFTTGSALYLYKNQLQANQEEARERNLSASEYRQMQMEAAYGFWKNSFGVPHGGQALNNAETIVRERFPELNELFDLLDNMASTRDNTQSVGDEIRERTAHKINRSMGMDH